MNVDPTGLDFTEAFGGLVYETIRGMTNGFNFDYSHIGGALRDGYNGQGSFSSSAASIAWSATEDF